MNYWLTVQYVRLTQVALRLRQQLGPRLPSLSVVDVKHDITRLHCLMMAIVAVPVSVVIPGVRRGTSPK